MSLIKTTLSTVQMEALCGVDDSNLQLISTMLDADIAVSKSNFKCKEKSKSLQLEAVIRKLSNIVRQQSTVVTEEQTKKVLHEVLVDKKYDMQSIEHKISSRRIEPKNDSQATYMQLIEDNQLVIGLGSAGGGKTLIAVAKAVEAFEREEVDKIIICRPSVATEDIGYLPGSAEEKLDPYLRPIYDSLEYLLGVQKVKKMKEMNQIEVAPIAFMRGRSFNRAFCILDEAQNCTPEQLQMFLTRLGFGSKAVVAGDMAQTDIKGNNALTDARTILKDIPSVAFHVFNKDDVVRSGLCQRIVEAYEKHGRVIA